jgi:hypothetical protein
MKKLRITLCAILLASCLLVPLSAFDWGGFLGNATGLTYDSEAHFSQRNKLGLWIKAPFSDELALNAQISYQFSLDRPLFADIDLLNLDGQFVLENSSAFVFGVKAGRFLFNDFSRLVLNHNLDGVRFVFELPSLSLSFGVGVTGFTFIPSSSIIMTNSDLSVRGSAPDHGFALAPPKRIEQLSIRVPGLPDRQEFNFTFIALQDLQSEENISSGNTRLHAEYIGFGVNGPLTGTAYYNGNFYLNLGHYEGKSSLGFLTSAGVRIYLEELQYSRIEIRGIFSTGDENKGGFYDSYTGSGIGTQFFPISRPSFGVIFSPQLGNMIVGELSYSLRPFSSNGGGTMENFQTMLKGLVFMRPTTGAISEPGINGSSSQLYLGTEADLVISFRPFSDLGMSLSGGIFFPNNAASDSAFDSTAQPIEFGGRFEFSFSF